MNQTSGQARRAGKAIALAWSASPAALLLVIAVTTVQGLTPVAMAWLTKLLLDDVATPGPGPAWWALAGLLGAGACAALLPHVNQHGRSILRRGVELAVQSRLFAAVNRVPGLGPFEQPAFHDRLRLAEEAGQVAPGQVVHGLTGLVQAAVTVTGFLAALLVIDGRFALIAAGVCVPALLAELRLSKARAGLMWQLSPLRRQAIHYSMLQGDLQAAKEIRIFGLADFLLGRMVDLLRRAHREERLFDLRQLRIQSLLSVVGMAAVTVGMLGVVGLALSGGLGVGTVALALVALPGVQSGLAEAARHLGDTHHAMLLFGHFDEVVSGHPASSSSTMVKPLRNAITLRDVWFRYADDQPWVLRGVDLTIPCGQTLALVGVNGAGKSTLVKLLCRFYDPVRGTIRWDDADLAELPHADLRRRISAVFQDFMIYDLTAAENIGVGNLERLTDLDAVRSAAARAGVDQALSSLPRGYDTMLSRTFTGGAPDDETSGVLLSGGQWQRVAVARSLLHDDSDLLILDEPTSGLDATAEHRLHQQLGELRKGRTTVLISHRLSTVRTADLIVVLDDGAVVETGTHDELLSQGGTYAELFHRQAEGYRSEVPTVPSNAATSLSAVRLPI